MTQRLIECRLFEARVIKENNGSKKTRLAGLAQKAEEKNNNNRVYPKTVLESAVQSLQEKIDSRSLVGALDHPDHSVVHLSEASHLITKLDMRGNEVIAEMEILSTPAGKIAQALIDDGVRLGISSRGEGSLIPQEDGSNLVENFKLVTFDLVADPSTKGAYPSLTESVQTSQKQKIEKVFNKFKSAKVLEVLLMDKINQVLNEKVDPEERNLRLNKVNKASDKYKEKSLHPEKGKTGHKANVNFGRAKAILTKFTGKVSKGDKIIKPQVDKDSSEKEVKTKAHRFLRIASKVKHTVPESIILKFNKLLSEGKIKQLNKAKKRDFEAKKGSEINKKEDPGHIVSKSTAINIARSKIQKS